MKFRNFIKSWATPPAVQGPTGLKIDSDFDRASAGTLGVLRAWVRDRWYEMDEADAKRLRPTFTRDPRAVRNEQLKRERLDRERRQGGLLVLGGDEEEYEPPIPRAEWLPSAPRGEPDLADLGDWDYITPPGGN